MIRGELNAEWVGKADGLKGTELTIAIMKAAVVASKGELRCEKKNEIDSSCKQSHCLGTGSHTSRCFCF